VRTIDFEGVVLLQINVCFTASVFIDVEPGVDTCIFQDSDILHIQPAAATNSVPLVVTVENLVLS
jgi:hypothetical protein